jgi:DNA topoisomerase-1
MSELKAKQLNKRKIVESSKTSKKSSSDSSKSIKSKKTKHSKDYDNSDDNDGNDSIEEEQGSDDNDNDDDDDDDDENDDDDDDENENEENDEDNNSKAKKKKISKPMKVKSKVKPKTKSESNGSSDKVLKIKKLTKLERLEEARKAFKWWEAADLPEGINWRYLEHPGMVFPASYIPHGVPMKYDGQILKLNPEQEELATFYAAIPEDGPQLGIAESRVLFQKNFFDEFKTYFPSSIMKDFKKCDFGLIKEHLEIQKNLKKAATAEEKEMKKEEKDKIQLKYSYALVDGRLEKVMFY